MSDDRLATWTKWLGLLLGVGYLAAAIAGLIGDVSDDDSDLVFWVLFLGGGGLLVLASLFATGLPRWLTLVFGIVGALAGALALFWTIFVPILAIVFAIMLVLGFRSKTAAAT